MNNLKNLSVEIYKQNKAKGFWSENPKERNFGGVIALIHSELSKALEADRKGKRFLSCPSKFIELNNELFKEAFEDYIKDSVEDELADVVIRVLDYCGAMDIDIEKHIEAKLRYNKMRSYKHGKAY